MALEGAISRSLPAMRCSAKRSLELRAGPKWMNPRQRSRTAYSLCCVPLSGRYTWVRMLTLGTFQKEVDSKLDGLFDLP